MSMMPGQEYFFLLLQQWRLDRAALMACVSARTNSQGAGRDTCG